MYALVRLLALLATLSLPLANAVPDQGDAHDGSSCWNIRHVNSPELIVSLITSDAIGVSIGAGDGSHGAGAALFIVPDECGLTGEGDVIGRVSDTGGNPPPNPLDGQDLPFPLVP